MRPALLGTQTNETLNSHPGLRRSPCIRPLSFMSPYLQQNPGKTREDSQPDALRLWRPTTITVPLPSLTLPSQKESLPRTPCEQHIARSPRACRATRLPHDFPPDLPQVVHAVPFHQGSWQRESLVFRQIKRASADPSTPGQNELHRTDDGSSGKIPTSSRTRTGPHNRGAQTKHTTRAFGVHCSGVSTVNDTKPALVHLPSTTKPLTTVPGSLLPGRDRVTIGDQRLTPYAGSGVNASEAP